MSEPWNENPNQDYPVVRPAPPRDQRPPGSLQVRETFWGWAQRRPILLCLLLAITLLATGASMVALTFAIGVESERQEIERELLDMQQQFGRGGVDKQAIQSEHYFNHFAQAELHYRLGDAARAGQQLAEATALPVRAGFGDWEWTYLNSVVHAPLFTFADGQAAQGVVQGLAFSPAGLQLAVGAAPAHSPYGPPRAAGDWKIWTLNQGQATAVVLPAPKLGVFQVAFSPDGAHFVAQLNDAASRDTPATVTFELASGKQLLEKPGYFLADGSYLVEHSPGGLTLRGAATGEAVGRVKARAAIAWHVSAGGQWLTTLDADGILALWDMGSSKLQGVLGRIELPAELAQVVFSQDGLLVALRPQGSNAVSIWSTLAARPLQTIRGAVEIDSIAFSPEGRWLAYGCRDGQVYVVEARLAQDYLRLRSYGPAVTALAFSPGGDRLAVGDAGGVVRVWDTTRTPDYMTVGGPAWTAALGFREENGRMFLLRATMPAAPSMLGDLEVWDPVTGALSKRTGHLTLGGGGKVPGRCTVFSADGQRAASVVSGQDNVVQVWDALQGKPLLKLPGLSAAIDQVALSEGGKLVAAVANHRPEDPKQLAAEVKVWDAVTGFEVMAVREPLGQIFAIALDAPGNLLAVAGMRYRAVKDDKGQDRWQGETWLEVWDLATKFRQIAVYAYPAPVTVLAFNSGQGLASADATGIVRLWEGVTLREAGGWQGPPGIADLAFHPTGSRLAAASPTQVVVWETPVAGAGRPPGGAFLVRELLRLPLVGSPAAASFNPRVVFSPGGTYLAANHADGRVFVWTADTQMWDFLVKMANKRATGAAFVLERARYHVHFGLSARAAADLAQPALAASTDPLVLFECAYLQACLGHWQKAAALLERGLALRPDDLGALCAAADLAAYLGNDEAYIRHCRALLSRFGSTDNPWVAQQVARRCLLLPGRMDDAKPALMALVERMVKDTEKHPGYAWMALAKGMAEYRSGEYRQALDWFLDSERDLPERSSDKALAQLLAALAYRQLGGGDEAAQALGQALEWLARHPVPSAAGAPYWHERLLCDVVRREWKQ